MKIKHQLHLLLVIAAILTGLTACQKSTKDQLVGTWHYAKTMTVDGSDISSDGVSTNNQNGTFSDEASMTVTTDTEVEGINVQLKIGISMKSSGEWTLNDKEIVFSPTSAGIKVTYMKYYDPSDGSFLAELTGKELKEASNAFADEMKESLLEASTERIIMLQENKYVTESTDDDGKKETITYNRMR